MNADRKNKGKQNFFQGAMILSVAIFFVKILGIVFKVALQPILEAKGTGYYYLSYNIFNMVIVITSAGLPVALSRLVAEYMTHERYRDVRRLKNIATLLFTITGSVGMFVLFIFARPLSHLVNQPLTYYTIMAFGPGILFLCLMSSYRGYYEGLHDMVPTAVSQSLEAIAKIVLALIIASKVKEIGLRQFAQTGLVFGQSTFLGEPILDIERATLATLHYASAGAIFGVALSTLVGLIYLFMYRRIKGDGITKKQLLYSPKPYSSKAHVKRLISIAIPVCMGAVIVSITSLIDVSVSGRRFDVAAMRDPVLMESLYSNFIGDNATMEDLFGDLYGLYSGQAETTFNLVPTFATAFATSILPTVTEAWVSNNKRRLQKSVESVLRLTSMIIIPASFGLICMAEPVLRLIFRTSSLEDVQFAAPLLSLLGISAIFVSLASLINAMLQGIGRTDLPMKFMLVGSLLKLICNYVLVAVPEINVKGMPIGTLVCYFFIVVAGLISLLSITDIKINLFATLIKPTIAGGICGLSAFVIYNIMVKTIKTNVSTLVSVAIAIVVYFVVLILIKGIAREDIIMLPKGENIAKRLEKLRIIR